MASICYRTPSHPGHKCAGCPHKRYDEENDRICCFMDEDNEKLIQNAKELIPKLTLGTLHDKSIVEVITGLDRSNKEVKYVHFFGYGYESDEDGDKPYRFVEYTFFIASLKEALDMGIDKYENEVGANFKQYIEDCDEDTLLNRYLKYNNGETPLPIPKEKLDINVPDGMYILL